MKFTKILCAGALTLTSVVALASCGSNKKNSSKSSLNVCIASTPDHVDPALNSAVDGATLAVHLFAGLVRYVPGQNGLELAPDLATTLPTATAVDGKAKYTFTLRDNITFGDGTPIVAQDFVDSWNRAASEELGADYSYMFDVIDRKDNGKLNVTAVDTKTLEVILPVEVPYFYELCAFPAYMPIKNASNSSVIDNDGLWAKNPKTLIASGAYKMTTYEKDVKIVLEKNDSYWDANSVKMDKVTFVLSDDDSNIYSQYMTGELQFIDTYPQTMQTELERTADYHNMGQLGTYYVSWNINSNVFAGKNQAQQEKIRKAISLLIDRKDIVQSVTKQGQTPSTGFVGEGLSDSAYPGSDFVDHNGLNRDGKGYCGDANDYTSNKAQALTLLQEVGYTVTNGRVFGFPTLTYLTNTGTGHEAVATHIQSTLNAVGITMTIEKQEWAQFLNTRKNGDYDLARNGWLSDFNDPISFLDMWTTESGNNDCQFGKDAAATNTYEIDLTGIGSYGKLTGTWAQTYDVLIGYINTEKNATIRYNLMHKAEDLLMFTGCITPIYNYTDVYLQKTNLKDVYASPLGYKYFHYAYTA